MAALHEPVRSGLRTAYTEIAPARRRVHAQLESDLRSRHGPTGSSKHRLGPERWSTSAARSRPRSPSAIVLRQRAWYRRSDSREGYTEELPALPARKCATAVAT